MTHLSSTTELLLRRPAELVDRIQRGGEELKALPLQLALVAIIGHAVFGFFLGLTRSPLAGVLASPKLVMMGLGSLAVCLPALYVYGRLLGNPSSMLQVVCEALAAMATAGMTLLALCPVWLVYWRLVDHPPFGYLHIMLGSIVFVGFAQLRGALVLVHSLRARKRQIAHMFAWIAIYGLVGIQAAWMLRPFVGTPHGRDSRVAFFRPLERSAFDATVRLVQTNTHSVLGFDIFPRQQSPGN